MGKTEEVEFGSNAVCSFKRHKDSEMRNGGRLLMVEGRGCENTSPYMAESLTLLGWLSMFLGLCSVPRCLVNAPQTIC